MEYYDPYKKPDLPLPAKVFDKNVLESVKTTRYKDKIEVSLPVGLTDGDEPFTFTFFNVDNDTAEFRDGGRAVRALARRADVAAFQKRIREFCKREGRLALKGGRELVLRVYPNRKYELLWDTYDFISFCAIVANFDLYPTSQSLAFYGKEDENE